MTLEERLAEAGVTTLEELEAKIKSDAITDAKAAANAEEAKLRKQISDLELIKGQQGTKQGELTKELEAAKEKLAEFEESKQTENEPPKEQKTEKSEADWKQENSEREQAFSDDDWTKVDVELKAAPPEAKKLIMTEAGRAAFYDRVLGSSKQEAQETLRRPVKKEKLTVAEQLDAYFGKDKKSGRVPVRQPSGIVTSSADKNQSLEPVIGASFSTRMAGIQTE